MTAKLYCVRRFVLLMPGEMWHVLDTYYHAATFLTTAQEFLDEIGLPRGKTAFYTPEERGFFNELYALWRERHKDDRKE